MTQSSKPLRVLVIDDAVPFRRQVAGALASSGLQVAEAGEGYEALCRVRAEAVFDLILADVHMPNMDGLTFIRDVRKLTGYADVPILVLTSDGSRERRQEGRLAGATAWLMKPPNLPALVHAVHAALLQLIKTGPRPPKSLSQLSIPGAAEPGPSSPFRLTSAQPKPPTRFSARPRAPSSSLPVPRRPKDPGSNSDK
jgi:two-component system chemotaxis response regulator CheY